MIRPRVLRGVAHEARAACDIPIGLTEIGIGTVNDAPHVRFTRALVTDVAAEIDSSLSVQGHIHWTLMEHSSWSAGHAPRSECAR